MYDLIVIGGGPAGLAAAYEASLNGVKKYINNRKRYSRSRRRRRY